MPRSLFSALLLRTVAFIVFTFPLLALGQTLAINDDIQTYATLTNTTVTMTGRSELRITGTSNPIGGCTINLNSPNAWFLMTNIRPSVVNSTYMGQIKVNGANAVHGTNVRVVQYAMGTVVIPHAPSFQPFEAFTGPDFTGTSQLFSQYTYYDNAAALGVMYRNLSSFKLKRGYMATVATQTNGSGISRNYVAQDGDLEVPLLPANLDNAIQYVRVFPWRWVSKKGSSDSNPAEFGSAWHYNWNNNASSTLDYEYVPIRQQRWWPGLPWNQPESMHLLGFNEPNNSVEDAYTSLDNGSVDTAVAVWPELQGPGLRLGAPAVTDGGKAWLYDFMTKADAANLRVDYIAIHNYQCGLSATALYNWLKDVYDTTGRPIWLTEFNNGANWTGCADPTFQQNADAINAFIDMMDNAPFIERYSIYSAVEEVRQLHYNAGGLTPMGVVYQANASPLSYVQEMPQPDTPAGALFRFDGGVADGSGNSHSVMVVGTPSFPAGKNGQAISFDGATDHVQLSSRLGDSTDFTFAGWVKWNGGGNWQRIFDFGAHNFRYLFLSPSAGAGNKLRFVINTGGGEQIIDGPSALSVGVWTHVAVTISGSTGKLFVNGALVATNTGMTANPIDVGTKHNYLGKSQWPADPRFNGLLDDVRFLPYALTDAQVAAMPTNHEPQFSGSPLSLAGATAKEPYATSLASEVTDVDGQAVTFSKLSGPAWLAVAADGRLIGIPATGDAGNNTFVIRAEDPVAGLALASVTVPVAVTPGIDARYAFDGDAKASVGLAHGTAAGSPTFVTGKYGQAIRFDGTDDVVTLPAGVADLTDFTIATWVYWNGTGDWQRIFDFGNGTSQCMYLTPRADSASGSKMRFAMKNGSTDEGVNASIAMPSGQWMHVAVTLSGNTATIYRNGVSIGSGPISVNPVDFRPTLNYIGDSQFAADPLFAGIMDEFVIYNHALSPSAVQALATTTSRPPNFTSDTIAGVAATPGTLYRQSIASAATDPEGGSLQFKKVLGPAWLHIAPNGTLYGRPETGDAGMNTFRVRATDPVGHADEATLMINVTGATGLVAQYLFDGSTSDAAGSNHGTATGSPPYVPGPFNSAIGLNGTSSYVTMPAGIANSSAITLAARVRWNGGVNWQRILDFGTGTSQYFYLTPKNSATGTIRFGIKNGGEQTLDAPTPLPIGEWTHVTVTLGGGVGNIYVNGAKVGTSAITHTPAGFNPTLNYAGKSQWASDPFLNAAIDEVRVYNRALSDSEVLGIVAAPFTANSSAQLAFDTWAAGNSFLPGEDAPDADPDDDSLPNVIEFLIGSNPLAGGANALPVPEIANAADLGLGETGKTYLTMSARVRRDRDGVVVTPRAATSIDGLSDPASAANVLQAGAPVPDGDFDIITYYFTTPIEDLPDGKGFMRLVVTVQ